MIIKNGTVMNPSMNTIQTADILVEDGVIRKIGENLDSEEQDVLDVTGLVVAPGLIDTHVHFRDPGFTYKEDMHTGAMASAKGGFTSVICMANTKPTVDSVETLEDILHRAENEKIRIYQTVAVTKGLGGKELTDMEALKAAGACGVTDDGIPLRDPLLCQKAMEIAASLDLPISLHEEDPAFITNNGINQGDVSEKLGVVGSPATAEETMVARDCMLALKTKAKTVIQHISSGNSVALVRLAKELGADIHAEATPHHFTLTDEALLKHGTLAKMNPPLRKEKDRQEIIAGLADGTIDLIATDHAPHSAEEKSKELTAAPSGITGLETALGLGVTSLVKPGHLTLMQLLERMSTNPAKLYKIPGGVIEEGANADFVIFNPDEEWVADSFASKSSNTPFSGEKLFGKIHYTICRGEIVYEG